MDQEATNEKEIEVQADTTEPKNAAPELNVSDLVGLKSIIDVATQRGAFKAAEMEAVGKIYNRLDKFIETVAKKD